MTDIRAGRADGNGVITVVHTADHLTVIITERIFKLLANFIDASKFLYFSEISFFSIYNQKLVADFLIQFSNFESHKKDFNFLVYGKEEKGNAVNDCNFILKNAFERLTADYDEETLYYLSLLILRLKNLEKGLEEDQLFLSFPDEGDTLSLLGFLGNPKYKKNISAIKKAYVMRVLRFFFQSDEGVIKNKDSIISQFITSNANYFASKALPYKRKVLQANFAKTPLSSLNLQGRIISRENFEKVFLTQSQLERVIDYDISDSLLFGSRRRS